MPVQQTGKVLLSERVLYVTVHDVPQGKVNVIRRINVWNFGT